MNRTCLLNLVILSTTAILAGCEPENNLQFWLGGDIMVDSKPITEEQNWAYGQGELSPLVWNQPLDDMQVQYRAPTTNQTELHLFAIDPRERRDSFDSLTDNEVNDGEGVWLQQTGQEYLPRAVVLPYPTEEILFGTPPAILNLAKFQFFDILTPQGVAAAPNGQSSVKSARVYNHGPCSHELNATDRILTLITDTFWMEFLRSIQKDAGCDSEGRRLYSHALAYLDHNEGQPHDLRGGFLFDFHFDFDHPGFVTDTKWWFNWTYRYRLEDGFLAVLPGQNFAQVTAGSQIEAQNRHEQMVKNLNVTLPQAFKEVTKNTQLANPFPGPVPCNPEAATSCNVPSAFFQVAIQSGATALNAAFEPDLFSPSEIEDLKTLSVEPEGEGRKNWRCASDATGAEPGNICQLVLRAKRLNVYPDTVELVWFDGKEIDNPTYALWVATHAAQAPPNATQQLCNFTPHANWYARPFAQVNAGFASSEQFMCPIAGDFEPGPCSMGPGTSTGWRPGMLALVLLGMWQWRRRGSRWRSERDHGRGKKHAFEPTASI